MNLFRSIAIAAPFLAVSVTPVAAQQDFGNLIDVATGLSSPVGIAMAPGDDTRLFIVEQGGRIRIINVVTDGLG
ncbi:MAG: hypothetical protein Q8L55_08950, partial [Phycisphaerales bacterium]|nr:hypothetical protein [Phycisphaerales bacterium]